MWAIRVYKNADTDKMEYIKLVDANTLKAQVFDIKSVKMMLSMNANSIDNLYIDNNNRLRIKDMTPSRNIKAFNTYYTQGYNVYSYCIILGHNNGLLTWIADGNSEQDIMYGVDNTLSEIASKLRVRIDKLKIFNGCIKDEQGKLRVYVYNKLRNTFTLIPVLKDTSVKLNDTVKDSWNMEGIQITPLGISVEYIESKNDEAVAKIPDGIYNIEEFGGGVNELEISDSVLFLGEECFSGLDDLYIVKFGIGITEIPVKCFEDSLIRKIKFSGNERRIRNRAFSDCYRLSGPLVTNAEIIDSDAFYDTALSIVNLPKITCIGKGAFSFNKKLQKVKLGNKLKYIKAKAFEYCTSIEEIEIPDSCLSIETEAFNGCKKLKKVILSEHTIVSKGAFPNKCKLVYR